MNFMRSFECGSCGRNWEVPYGKAKPRRCPGCGSEDVFQSICGSDLDSAMLDPHLFS